MIGVHVHLQEILDNVGPVSPIDVALSDAVGCILAEDLVAERDVPAARSAATDGYAVDAAELSEFDPTVLPVTHDIRIGDQIPRLVPGTCVRVTSGAALPDEATAVVPPELTDRGEATVVVQKSVPEGFGVREQGADVQVGAPAIAIGTRLGARQLALAAAMGRGRLLVHPKPRVVILSIGDELLNPGSRIVEEGAVFDANAHALTTAVAHAGGVPLRVGVVGDDRSLLRDVIEDQLVRADVIITTGGLSESTTDTVKDVLALLGTVRFDHVAMSPGRRHGFGTVGDEVPIFALPGHPVAAQIAYEIFVRPALLLIGGHTEIFRPSVRAVAQAGFDGVPGRRAFVPAEVLGHPDEGYTLTPLGTASAWLPGLTDLATANALAVVPEDAGSIVSGDLVNCMVLDG